MDKCKIMNEFVVKTKERNENDWNFMIKHKNAIMNDQELNIIGPMINGIQEG
jgi:hypothetical protein